MMKAAPIVAVQLNEALQEGGNVILIDMLKTMEPTMSVNLNSSIRQCCRISNHLQELSLG